LPELDEEQLRTLGQALYRMRSTCAISQRRLQDYHARIGERLRAGYPFDIQVGKLVSGQDTREDILAFDDTLFDQFIDLMQDVGQDSGSYFDYIVTIQKGFGLQE
jgi:hypothetical protein